MTKNMRCDVTGGAVTLQQLVKGRSREKAIAFGQEEIRRPCVARRGKAVCLTKGRNFKERKIAPRAASAEERGIAGRRVSINLSGVEGGRL